MRFHLPWMKPGIVPVTEERQNTQSEVSGTPEKEYESKEGFRTGTPTAEEDGNALDADAQVGVQKIQAATSVWSKNQLILAYVL